MFAFKCDAGYVPYPSSGKPIEPTKLSDVVFMDYNQPFTILDGTPTGDNYISVPYSSGYEVLEKYISNDVNTLWCPWFNFDDTKFNRMTGVFPSIGKLFANLGNYISANYTQPNTTPRIVIYIKSLNRLLSIYGIGPTGRLNMYSVNGDSLTSVYVTNTYGAPLAWASLSGTQSSMQYIVRASGGIKDGDYYALDATMSTTFAFRISKLNSYVNMNELMQALFSSVVDPKPDYTPGPYDPGGPSGPGDGPPGSFDDTSDPIPDPPPPTISGADTGFSRIYNPTLSQLQDFARYLWTDYTIVETLWNHLKQYLEDPMQSIIGLNLLPCPVPDGGTETVRILFFSTGVQMTKAATQFVDVDCGTYELERYYGSALDQNPYTKVSCFLPYIGTVHLNTDEVMGTTLQVKYRIDIVSGSCVAKILVDGTVLYQYSGHCAITIPISAADFSSYVSAAIGVGAVIAGMAVGAAAGGSVAVGSEVVQSTGAESAVQSTALSTMPSSPPSTIGQHEFAAQQLAYMSQNAPALNGTQASFKGLGPENILNTVGQVMGGKTQVEHSGAFSGNSGYLGVRRPFLIIERPNMCLPETYGQLNGYPSMITLTLGECSGFTRIQQVQLTGCTATNPEQSEILQFLKSGVVL